MYYATCKASMDPKFVKLTDDVVRNGCLCNFSAISMIRIAKADETICGIPLSLAFSLLPCVARFAVAVTVAYIATAVAA